MAGAAAMKEAGVVVLLLEGDMVAVEEGDWVAAGEGTECKRTFGVSFNACFINTRGNISYLSILCWKQFSYM